MSYTWKWALDEKGLVPTPLETYGKEELQKKEYVEKYLSPSIEHAKCGWDAVKYVVMGNGKWTVEYAVLLSEGHGRYYDVTGNSLGAVAECIWAGVYC